MGAGIPKMEQQFDGRMDLDNRELWQAMIIERNKLRRPFRHPGLGDPKAKNIGNS